LVLIAGIAVGERFFHRYPLSRRQLSALFAAWSAGCGAWSIPLWGRWWVFVAMISLSVFFAWASVGVEAEWPVFRSEPEPDEEAEEDAA
jgi:hypothetical protein